MIAPGAAAPRVATDDKNDGKNVDPIETSSPVIDLAERLRPIFAKKDLGDLSVRYEIGAEIVEARKAAPKALGDEHLKEVAELVGRGEKTLENCARVAEQWSPGEFAELADRRMPDGDRLCWTHFRVVSPPWLTDQDRRRWIEKALDVGYTARRLREEIASALETEVLRSFRRFLRRQCELAKQIAAQESKLELLAKVLPDLDPALLIETHLALEAAQRLTRASQRSAETLRAILRRQSPPTDGGLENVFHDSHSRGTATN